MAYDLILNGYKIAYFEDTAFRAQLFKTNDVVS